MERRRVEGWGNDVVGRKADADSLLRVAEEFGVREEAGSMKGLRWRQRSRCCPGAPTQHAGAHPVCPISSHGDQLARRLILQQRQLPFSDRRYVHNGEHETSLCKEVTLVQGPETVPFLVYCCYR